MAKAKLLHRARHIVHKSTPGHVVRRNATTRIIKRFADDIGMVYFGYVDQTDDDHRLMRGMTVSTTHDDNYYSVGTFKGYDVALTVRRDTLTYPDMCLHDHHWTIMTFDLHSVRDVPHLFIGHNTIRDELLAKHSDLSVISFGPHTPHDQQFLGQYSIYARMINAAEVEWLFPPEITRVIAQRFDGLSIELHDNTVYLYTSEKHPTRPLLERMMNTGLWLAATLDERLARPVT